MTIRMKSRAGADGMIDLRIPAGVTDSEVEVEVRVSPVKSHVHSQWRSDEERLEWERFVDRTEGSIQDPTFVRQPQGQFEKRDEL